MKKTSAFLILLLFLAEWAFAQSGEHLLIAKIIADSVAVEKVNVLNLRNYKTTFTDRDGIFQMPVKIDDILVITAVNLETRRKTIIDTDLKPEMQIIRMSNKMTQVQEVDVNRYPEINSENLRITPHGQKRYTPAERKVRTATTGILDPLLNKMSGRTTMLKKEVLVERNERLLLKLDGLYEDKYYLDVLKIPDAYIQGFQYYIIEDPDFARALNDKNKTLTMFYIKKLAMNYNEIIRKQEVQTGEN